MRFELPKDFRNDDTLDEVHPNAKIGKKSRFIENGEEIGLCRYCGIKTDNYQELKNGIKQPVCSLLCGGLLLEIEDLIRQNDIE